MYNNGAASLGIMVEPLVDWAMLSGSDKALTLTRRFGDAEFGAPQADANPRPILASCTSLECLCRSGRGPILEVVADGVGSCVPQTEPGRDERPDPCTPNPSCL